jgi:hypothetical protein
MKIVINQESKYEMDMQEFTNDAEVSFEDFKILTKKLDVVVSCLEKMSEISAKQTSQVSSRKYLSPKNREERTKEDIIQMIKAATNLKPNTPEMDEALKRFNISWNTVNQMKSRWIERYNIVPADLGVETF